MDAQVAVDRHLPSFVCMIQAPPLRTDRCAPRFTVPAHGAEIDHYASAIAAEGGLSASLAYYRDAAESARRNHDALERGHLTVPVLGISSSHDSIPDMAASVGPWAKNATGVVIPQAGHFIPAEQPDATVDVLSAFIDHERAE